MEITVADNEVSSAEITAIYRCAIPELSGDILSKYLVSAAGKERAQAFIEKYDYTLAPLKISLCAAYFLNEATRLLATGLYDSCISLASGFSLLIYLIAERNAAIPGIKYFDTDLDHIVDERNIRIDAIKKDLLDSSILENIQSKAFDIEQAYQKDKTLMEVFPGCHRPIFILDGVSYFLSLGCVEWLIKQMGSYDQSAVTMYYWPVDMLSRSALFSSVFNDLNKEMILEELKSFWDATVLEKFRLNFSHTCDLALEEVEAALVPESERKLIDPNKFFPVRLITGENPGPF